MLLHKDTNQLKNADLPVNNKEHPLASTDKKWLSLAVSDLDSDAGQSVLPYIDVQPVEPNPPTPLSGVRFYHKAAQSTGGFLGLELLAHDMVPHMG